MAKNLLDLADSMEKKAKEIDLAASKSATDAALAIVGSLAFRTPVDTSQAISNWIITLDIPSLSNISPHFPGDFGSTYKQSAAETIQLAKAVLKNKKPGQAIYIVNNLPYIVRLNEGYSAQEPAGFVERAVLIGRKTFSKFELKG